MKNTASFKPAAHQHRPAERSSMLQMAAEFGAEAASSNPYLSLLAVSGSLSRPEGKQHNDIDFFAISSAGHVWDAFMLCLWQGWRFASRKHLPRTFLCFNYLVDERHPQEIDLTQAEHVRSFLNLIILSGHETYHSLLLKLRTELESQEPVLYKETLKRVKSRLQSCKTNTPAVRNSRPWASLLVFTARIPFMLAIKRAEAIRRGYYPGGFIFSNSRVIRSHLRVAWENPTAARVCPSAGEAFSSVSSGYQAAVVVSPANMHMRGVVHEVLETLIQPGMRVLDIGAGTGEDALWLANRGIEVLATDVALGMVREVARRVAESGLGGKVQVRCLAIENLRELLPAEAQGFDIILADFGALNLAGRPENWGPVLARLLKPDGRLVANMVNRWCLWEIFAGLARGRVSYGLRRLRGEPVRVGDRYLPVTLFTPGAFAQKLRMHFVPAITLGLCVTALPPDLENTGRKFPALARFLAKADRAAGRMKLLRNLGDHYLMVLQKKPGPLVELHLNGGITAAPCVTDLNRDNVPEIILAADKLYITGPTGRSLRGWPRSVGAAIAATAAFMSDGDRTSIYVGSDNDYLNSFHLQGTRIGFRRFRTGGDIFSSPWTGDLLGDGSKSIVFGSDDNHIYAIDENATMLPGWPFSTGGYVAASPVAIDTDGGTVVALGSWDGKLYLLDKRGQNYPGWPRELGSPIWSTAAVADIDGCGKGEIIVTAQKLFVFQGDGSPVAGFPLELGGYAVASPAVGDINGDGKLEIVACSDRIYAVDAQGRTLAGFPFSTGCYVWASPILFDIDGDGLPEIVVGDFRGRLWAIKGDGKLCKGFPQQLGRSISSPATAADIDGDGYLELLVGTMQGRFLSLSTDCHDDPASAPWPQFRGRGGKPLSIREPNECKVYSDQPSERAISLRYEGSNPVSGVELHPSVPRPFELTEIHLILKDGSAIRGGLLEYELDGSLHPSPLLKSDGHYLGLIQPLRLLKSVDFNLKLDMGDKGYFRYPEFGSLRIRVGMRGIKPC